MNEQEAISRREKLISQAREVSRECEKWALMAWHEGYYSGFVSGCGKAIELPKKYFGTSGIGEQ